MAGDVVGSKIGLGLLSLGKLKDSIRIRESGYFKHSALNEKESG
jgi:hypothetical protein